MHHTTTAINRVNKGTSLEMDRPGAINSRPLTRLSLISASMTFIAGRRAFVNFLPRSGFNCRQENWRAGKIRPANRGHVAPAWKSGFWP
jgi:hypothetical protein